jgi:hypothetical protein
MNTTTSIVATTTNNNANVNTATQSTENPKQPLQKQTAQQLVRENVQYLIEQLEAGHSEALTGFLRAMAVFRTYSLANQMAIARQRPTASRVAGMYGWNQLGRYVNKGEKGIAILAPVVGKESKGKSGKRDEKAEKDKNGTMLLGFRRVYVFAQEQTHGLPLPELEQVTGDAGVYLERMREWVASEGITLEYTEEIAPALGMAYGTTIRILPGQSEAEELTTLIHEAAHLALKHGTRRTTTTKTVRETEAEAVAFVVAQGIGIKAQQSASYIQLYKGNAALLLESLEAVQRTSAVILAALLREDAASQEATEDVEPAQTVTTEAA